MVIPYYAIECGRDVPWFHTNHPPLQIHTETLAASRKEWIELTEITLTDGYPTLRAEVTRLLQEGKARAAAG